MTARDALADGRASGRRGAATSTAAGMIVRSLHASHRALRDSVFDLTQEEYLQRPAEGAECAAWVLGHAVFADHEALRESGAFPPDLECVSDDFATRFAVRGDDGSVWPAEVDDLLPSFTAYRLAIIRVAAGLTPGSIDRPVHGVVLPNNEPAIPYTTTGTMLVALSAYTSMLVGELSVIRSGLGRPPLVHWFCGWA
jgi:DinB superfamily